MINFQKFILSIMLSVAISTAATIAALEITIVGDDDNEVELTVDETMFLSDEFRRQAVKAVPSGYSVLTREQMIASISNTKDDFVNSGYVEIGKALKSDYVTYGTISKLEMGNLLMLTIGLYETSTGLLLSEMKKEARDLKELLDAIREKTPELFAVMKQDTEVPPSAVPKSEPKPKAPIWVPVGLDVLGVAALGLGIYFSGKADKDYKSYKNMENDLPKKKYDSAYDDVKSAAVKRNIFYATGTALLLAGVTVHIWF